MAQGRVPRLVALPLPEVRAHLAFRSCTFGDARFADGVFSLMAIYTESVASFDVTAEAVSRTSEGAAVYQSLQGTVAPVPEPSTYALMLVGLGAVGWATRLRRQTIRLGY